MSVFKASKDLNVEGNGQVITREPGIYEVQVEKVAAGVKREGSGDAAVDTPTLDITLVVKKVVKLHKPDAHNAQEIVGKKHTDQIKLKATDQKTFDTMVKRIGHILTKAGVDKNAIVAVELASLDAKGWAKYQADIIALFDATKHTTQFNFKVIGGVYNGNTFTTAPGYLGFASALDEEQKFSSAEIKGNNDYYNAVSGVTPSADPTGASGAVGGGGVVAGAAF
jgi:hypothetical protein